MADVARIDIAALFGEDAAARAACDAALWAGLRRTGAVVLTGYPEADWIDARARTGLAFFAQREAEKRKLATRLCQPGNPNTYRGYHPHDPAGNFRTDFLDIGPAEPAPGPELPGIEIVTEPTPWPETEPAPGWRDAVRDYYATLDRIGKAIMLSLGRSAGFDEDTIHARFDGEHSTLRFLDYPPSGLGPAPDGAPRIAARLHTDASGLSLLWQGGPGLQAQGPDGAFHDVPVLKNCISLHVGTVMESMTGGAVPATPHRVLDPGVARQSVGFFLEPALTAPVTAVDRAREAPRVEDTYGWQLLRQLSSYDRYAGVISAPVARN